MANTPKALKKRLFIRYGMAVFNAYGLGKKPLTTQKSPFWVRAWSLAIKRELYQHCVICCPDRVSCEPDETYYRIEPADCHYCDCHVDY